MKQLNALDGKKLDKGIELTATVEKLFEGSVLPNGLIGIDEETGMVHVAITKEKKQFMKIGKLLRKAGMNNDVCREISGNLKATISIIKGAELKFTSSGDEAYDIYERGPSSCMSGNEAVRCYDTDDVCVAYAEVEDKVVARSVVCINEEIGLQYISIYGFETLMKALLEKAGFIDGDLRGCTLARIEDNSQVLCPYLDCGSRVSISGDFLEVGIYGDCSATDTEGYLGTRCEHCEELLLEEDLRWSEHTDKQMCDSCYEECHVYVNGEYYHKESGKVVLDINDEYILDEEAYYSEHHSSYIHEDYCTYSDYSEDYYKHDLVIMAITNVVYPEGEPCLVEDCTLYNSKWIHDNILEEYTQQDLFEGD